jgi:hypothetical protein
VTYALSGQHEALFNTPALSIAVIIASKPMAARLKQLTEEALQEIKQPEQGELFFFCRLDTALASPEEMYLSPVWEQAFSDAKVPLLVLDEENE